MDSYKDSTTGLAGKDKAKKPKKELSHIVSRKAKGGVIHTHHFSHSEAHPPEEHISANDQALVQHMMQNMSTGNPGPANDGDADDAPQGAPAQTATPAAAGPPGM